MGIYINNIDYRLSRNIKYWRTLRGFKVKDFAKKLGKTARTINNYENARTEPTLDTCKKMCSILNISLDDLFNLKEYGYSNELVEINEQLEDEDIRNNETSKHIFNMINDTNLLYFLCNTYYFVIGYKTHKNAKEIHYVGGYDVIKFNLNSNYATVKDEFLRVPIEVELIDVVFDELSPLQSNIYDKFYEPFENKLDDYANENETITPLLDNVKKDILNSYNPSQTISIDDFRRKLSSIKNYIEYIFFMS